MINTLRIFWVYTPPLAVVSTLYLFVLYQEYQSLCFPVPSINVRFSLISNRLLSSYVSLCMYCRLDCLSFPVSIIFKPPIHYILYIYINIVTLLTSHPLCPCPSLPVFCIDCCPCSLRPRNNPSHLLIYKTLVCCLLNLFLKVSVSFISICSLLFYFSSP